MQETLKKLRLCFQSAMDMNAQQAKSITVKTSMWDLPEWDSLAHARLLLEIGETFSRDFDEDDAEKLDSVEAILDTLRDHS